jgi:HNH endonuclease
VSREQQFKLEDFQEQLEYVPETGFFYWKVGRAGVSAGEVAGSATADHHWRIRVLGARFMAHRLAWLYVHGEWPSGPIDHIDGDGWNNVPSNLRLATPRLNAENKRRAAVHNQSGFLGVTQVGTRWKATIGSRGKNYYVGTFASPDEAHAAYVAAKRSLHAGCTL